MIEVVVEERMLELDREGTSQDEILTTCSEEFGSVASKVFEQLFTTQDRIARRLGIKV